MVHKGGAYKGVVTKSGSKKDPNDHQKEVKNGSKMTILGF
jgi:hypothetical protein